MGARALGLLVVAVALILAGQPGDMRLAGAEAFPLDAIGRVLKGDQYLCTAFAVRSLERRGFNPYYARTVFENWIVTAGHCFAGDLWFQQGRNRHRITRVIGFSGDVEGYDVLVAAFYTPTAVPTLELGFGEYPQPGDPLLLIGYARSALTMRVNPLLGYDARGHMEIAGYASPGTSGGPVLLPGTRRVVGIGIETTLDRPAGAAPLHCVFVACRIKPPYTAAHIDRIKGVARFP